MAQYQEALRLKPDYAEAHTTTWAMPSRSKVSWRQRWRSIKRPFAIKPDYAEAHSNRALTWLLAGDFKQGWPEYEWRWRTKHMRVSGLPSPSLFGTAHP